AIFVPPIRASFLIDIFQVRAVSQPDLHLACRTNRHQQIAFELGARPTLLAETVGNISANRFTRAADLIRQPVLLDLWKLQRRPMQIERDAVRSLEYVEILE